MELKRFRTKHKLTAAEVVDILSETFPQFGKATCSMVENPGKYGVKLLPRAEAILRREIKTRKEQENETCQETNISVSQPEQSATE